MSIHDFHSKLVSGKEEGLLIEGLRRLRGIAWPMAMEGAEPPPPPGWTYWTEGEGGADGATAEGWTHWETGPEALSRV